MTAIEKMVEKYRSLVPRISPQTLQTKKAELIVYDCRESDEVQLGIIPGAQWLPKGKAELNIEKLVPDKSSQIVIYCASGIRSVLVCKLLLDLDYKNIMTLDGGIEAWKNAGLPITSLTEDKINLKRYKAQIVMPSIGESGQAKLKNAKVLIIGAGGLGSPTALYLTAAGVGHIGIADHDIIDESNLQRQILHTTDRIGLEKVESAFLTLKALNPHVKVSMHKLRIDEKNIDEIIQDYQVVIDGCDNFSTRYLVNQACLKNNKINIHGSVFGYQGQIAIFCSDDGPCYRCIFPTPPSGDLAPNCAEGGVLGAVVGVTGSLVAVETIKWILQTNYLNKSMICYDGLSSTFDLLNLKKDPQCPSCSLPRESLSYKFDFDSTDYCEVKING